MWLECAGMDPTIAVPWKRLMWAWLYHKQTPVLLRLSLLKSKTYLAWKWSFRLFLRDFGDHRLLTIGNDSEQAGNETSRRHILVGRESLLFGKFRRRIINCSIAIFWPNFLCHLISQWNFSELHYLGISEVEKFVFAFCFGNLEFDKGQSQEIFACIFSENFWRMQDVITKISWVLAFSKIFGIFVRGDSITNKNLYSNFSKNELE